jgi:drug/metabolite transporter (DMT)-like permease
VTVTGEQKLFTATSALNEGEFTGRDWALFLAVAGIWGSSFLFIAVGLESMTPGLVTLARVGFGAAALALLPRRRIKIARQDRRRLVVLSLVWVAIPFTLFPIAEQHISSAVAGLLNGGTPIFAAVVATVLLRQPPRGTQLAGIVVGFVGVALVSIPSLGSGSSEALGVVLVIIAIACYGFAVNLAGPMQQRYGSVNLMAKMLALATLWTLPYGLWHIGSVRPQPASIAAVLFLGVVGTGVAFALMGSLVGRVGPTRASLITYVIPVVALVLGVVFRGDEVAPLALVGVAFVIGGAVLASRRQSGSTSAGSTAPISATTEMSA